MVGHAVTHVLERGRQEDQVFRASLGCTVRPCLLTHEKMVNQDRDRQGESGLVKRADRTTRLGFRESKGCYWYCLGFCLGVSLGSILFTKMEKAQLHPQWPQMSRMAGGLCWCPHIVILLCNNISEWSWYGCCPRWKTPWSLFSPQCVKPHSYAPDPGNHISG